MNAVLAAMDDDSALSGLKLEQVDRLGAHQLIDDRVKVAVFGFELLQLFFQLDCRLIHDGATPYFDF